MGFFGALMKEGGPLAYDSDDFAGNTRQFNKDFFIAISTIFLMAAYPQFWFIAVILATGRWIRKK